MPDAGDSQASKAEFTIEISDSILNKIFSELTDTGITIHDRIINGRVRIGKSEITLLKFKSNLTLKEIQVKTSVKKNTKLSIKGTYHYSSLENIPISAEFDVSISLNEQTRNIECMPYSGTVGLNLNAFDKPFVQLIIPLSLSSLSLYIPIGSEYFEQFFGIINKTVKMRINSLDGQPKFTEGRILFEKNIKK